MKFTDKSIEQIKKPAEQAGSYKFNDTLSDKSDLKALINDKYSSFRVYVMRALIRYMKKYPTIEVAQETMVRDTGVCMKTVRATIAQMREDGLLMVIGRFERTSIYILHPIFNDIEVQKVVENLFKFMTKMAFVLLIQRGIEIKARYETETEAWKDRLTEEGRLYIKRKRLISKDLLGKINQLRGAGSLIGAGIWGGFSKKGQKQCEQEVTQLQIGYWLMKADLFQINDDLLRDRLTIVDLKTDTPEYDQLLGQPTDLLEYALNQLKRIRQQQTINKPLVYLLSVIKNQKARQPTDKSQATSVENKKRPQQNYSGKFDPSAYPFKVHIPWSPYQQELIDNAKAARERAESKAKEVSHQAIENATVKPKNGKYPDSATMPILLVDETPWISNDDFDDKSFWEEVME